VPANDDASVLVFEMCVARFRKASSPDAETPGVEGPAGCGKLLEKKSNLRLNAQTAVFEDLVCGRIIDPITKVVRNAAGCAFRCRSADSRRK